MLTHESTIEGLTRLTRLARLRGDGGPWLERALARRRLEELAEPAVDIAIETGDPIGRVLARTVATRATPALAARLSARCDQPVLDEAAPLSELALEATRVVLAHHRCHAREKDPGHRDMLARLLNRLARCFYHLGRRDEALTALEEACEIDRQLAGENTELYGPSLSASLDNLSSVLSEVARFEEALEAVEESVGIDRRLLERFPQDPEKEAHLALSLHNLADRLVDLGRLREALAASREAVARYRQLAESDPGGYRLRLAESLRNLGTILAELDDAREAVAVTREARTVLDQLEARWPNVYSTQVAHLYLNLGIFLDQLGDPAAADYLRRAETRYRRLADERSEVFEADLALCLLNLGETLRQGSRLEEALAAAREAVARYQQLTERRPEVFEGDLATALHNLGAILSEGVETEEAIEVLSEAAERFRAQTLSRPRVFLDDLAMSLTVLAAVLGEAGQARQGLAVAREAAEIYRKLALEDAERFQTEHAHALLNLAAALIDCEQWHEASLISRQVVTFYNGLRPALNRATQDDLAMAWNQLSTALSGVGDRQGALEAARASVDLRRTLATEDPERYRADLAASLVNQASIHREHGDPQQASTTAEEALRLLTRAPGQLRSVRSVAAIALRVYRESTAAAHAAVDGELVDRVKKRFE